MTTYTRLASTIPAYDLTATISSSSATSVVLALTDGTSLTLTGTGFVVSGGQMTAGFITAMTHNNSSNVAVETWTGISNYPATAFQGNLSPSVNSNAIYTAIFSGADAVYGSNGAETLQGYAGNDFFRGFGGNDIIDGGAGEDFVDYSNDASSGGNAVGVVVNLSANAVNYGGVVAAGTARDGFGSTDTLISIEDARGTAYADVFVGGTGLSFFQGRGGADTYITNVVQYIDNYYVNNGYGWVDYQGDGGTSGVTVNLATGTGIDTFGSIESYTGITAVRGSGFADTLTGNQYYNVFQGLQGADIINGGGGYDRVDYTRDQGAGGANGVTVDLAAQTGVDGFGTTDTLISIEQVIGTALDDTIRGNNWNNFLVGLNGNDTLVGRDGFDTMRPGLGTDTVDGSVGSNLDQSYDDRDRVDYSDLGPGANGLGVIVNFSTSFITHEGFTVAGNTARDTGGSTDTLIDIERARGTSGRDYFRGSDTANFREEEFRGLAGDDYIHGGAGLNIVSYNGDTSGFAGTGAGGTSGAIVNLSGSSITVGAFTVAAGTARDPFGNTDTLININYVNGTGFADHVVGDAGVNRFRSNGGADFFDGGAGTRDVLSLFMDDTFFITPGTGSTVDMVAGTATNFYDNTVITFINVEDIDGSELNDTITGNSGANQLNGDLGNDTLNGGAGNDVLIGGTGNDTLNGGADFDIASYFYDPSFGAYYTLQFSAQFPAAFEGVEANLATGIVRDYAGGIDTIVLGTIEGLAGTFFNDILIGDAADNRFYGFSGNDIIDGGAGNDTISFADWGNTAGSGAPTLIGINASRPNGVTVDLVAGTANDSEGGSDILTSIESVIGSTGADTITGGLTSGVINGAGGTDLYQNRQALAAWDVSGIAGSYVFTSILDGHVQTVQDFENYSFAGATAVAAPITISFNIVGGGTGTDNLIVAGASNDSADGLGGNDTIYTLGGNDRAFGGLGNDILVLGLGDDAGIGGDGDDFLLGEDGNDALGGGAGNDILLGGNGNDVLLAGDNDDYLFGGAGDNVMNGGAGTDIFISEGANDIMNGGDGAGYFYRGIAGTSSITGGINADIFVGGAYLSNDIFNGGGGSDFALGGMGNDFLSGGDGNDILIGEAGNDILDGGAGFNYLYADGGNDLMRVNATLGGDQLLLFFDAGGTDDVVEISGSSMTSFADYQALTTNLGTAINGNLLQNVGVGAILTLNLGAANQTSIWFLGVSAYSLTASDFTFV